MINNQNNSSFSQALVLQLESYLEFQTEPLINIDYWWTVPIAFIFLVVNAEHLDNLGPIE